MHIDWWTLALQTVNVLVLIWILARFLFRPMADLVAKRQEETGKLLADAAQARQEATEVRAQTEKARSDLDAERDRLIAEARRAAEQEKVGLLAQSTAEIDKLRDEATAAIARERTAADHAIVAHASDLSVDIARRLLERLPPGRAFELFLDGACQELRNAPPDVRKSLITSMGEGGLLEVVTASLLNDAQREGVKKALASVLGVEPSLEFKSDPALIGGIELHGRNAIIRNSWRADLDRIRKELSHDGHRSKP